MPSSLTANISSALVFSTQPPVSVYGTGVYDICLADFLGSRITHIITSCKQSVYYQVRLSRWICLPQSTPTPFNVQFRLYAVLSLLRLHITPIDSMGILTHSAIVCAFRLRLRTRLTLIRLALIRKPWSFGEGGSRPLYRYLYLHLRFQKLQLKSSFNLLRRWNAPLPILYVSHGFGKQLMPEYYPCQNPRLVSCYALFK